MGELITEEQAIQAGMTLQAAMTALDKASELEVTHGSFVASLVRMQALKTMHDVLHQPTIAAIVLSGAGTSYEVANSEKYKLSNEQVLLGLEIALGKKYLLSDENGHHFSIFSGKGGSVSITVKETGHRYKLAKKGCTNIQAPCVTRCIRKRPNNPDKYEMVIDGKAFCTLDGRHIEVNRTGDFPIILPCYETDGSDGPEAKARRRVLSALWSVVSGEPEEQEPDDDDDAPSVTVGPVKTLEMPETVMIANQTSVENVWSKERQLLKSDSARAAWDAVAESKSAADVSKSMARASASLKAGTISSQDLQSLNRLADSRISELAAGVA